MHHLFRRLCLHRPIPHHHHRSISNLRVKWRKDPALDAALDRDKRYTLCSRVVREVLSEPGHRIPLRYLAKRRHRLRLPTKLPAFLSRHPNLFELYPDRIKPNTPPVPFLRPSPHLLSFLQSQSRIQSLHEPLAVLKLSKILAMSKDRVISAEKLFNVKRDFGLPDDFLTELVPKYPALFRLVGSGVGSKGGERTFIELISSPEENISKLTFQDEAETGINIFKPTIDTREVCVETKTWVSSFKSTIYTRAEDDSFKSIIERAEAEKMKIGVNSVKSIIGTGAEDNSFKSIIERAEAEKMRIGVNSVKSIIGTREEEVKTGVDRFKSVIEMRAEAEEKATGIKMRPNFVYKLPSGFYLKREMREWVRDWLEMPYISPYEDASGLHPASPEMEKRTIGLLHELLSLTLMKRMAVPVIGKFCEEFRLSNAFVNAFTRHSGIFYLSLKGGIETAVLREAYEAGELVDRDPLLEIKDLFVEMMEEGHREYLQKLRSKKERLQRDLETLAIENASRVEEESEEADESSVTDEEDESFEEEDEL